MKLMKSLSLALAITTAMGFMGSASAADTSKQVDVVFVVDDSGSTAVFHNYLGAEAENLFLHMAARSLDWTVRIYKMDSPSPVIEVIKSTDVKDVDDATAKFQAAMGKVGTSGPGRETMLKSLKDHATDDANFARAESRVTVILATDAAEQSWLRPSEVLKVLFKKTKDVKVHGFFHTPEYGCKGSEEDWKYEGSAYQTVIEATDGEAFSLCKDLPATYKRIGKTL